MHPTAFVFAQAVLNASAVRGKRVLEVGSFNVNGSIRKAVVAHGPALYWGVDLQPQRGYVDEVLSADRLVERFGAESFDVVACLEMLEHVRDWRAAVRNLKGVLRPGGLLVLTCRGPGFPRHNHPGDYWRFTVADVGRIFADFQADSLAADPTPGVLFAGRKGTATAVDLDRVCVSAVA